MRLNQEELRDFYLQNRSRIRVYILGFVRDVQTADDLMQQAFLELIKKYQKGNPVRNPLAFVYRVARNVALRHLRKKKVECEYRADVCEKQSSLQQEEADCQAGELESRIRRMIHAVATLPGEQQEVLALKIWQDLSFQAIAELTDTPVSTLLSRYQYALKKLKKLLSAS